MRVLVADDHSLFRDGIIGLLEAVRDLAISSARVDHLAMIEGPVLRSGDDRDREVEVRHRATVPRCATELKGVDFPLQRACLRIRQGYT